MPEGDRTARARDVVVFGVIREAPTSASADCAALGVRAEEAGDLAAEQRLLKLDIELAEQVDAIDPRDRAAQLKMTDESRALQLQQQIDSAK